jgi:glycosyltransferase involved in cell wall biosynthesis
MPRVTIGMPVYNGERFIVETLDCIVAQNYKDYELVISDNGSTDATEEICRRYAAKDARIRYYRETENRGATWNYNRVVELAQGEFFKWAAHDDLITADYIAKCVDVLDRDAGVVLACSDDQDIDVDGNHVDARRYSHIPSAERGSSEQPSKRFRRLLRDDYDCEQVFGLYRTAVLRKTRMIQSYTDSDRTLLAEIGLYGRLFEIPERLFLHRQHMGSSCRANPISGGWHERAAWFDPRLSGKALFSRWRQLREYTDAVIKSPVPFSEKAVSLFWLVAFQRSRVKALTKELVIGLRFVLGPKQRDASRP